MGSWNYLRITRGELGLGVLDLWAPPDFFLMDDGFGPGQQTKRRETVSSPWVAGRFATAIVPDVQIVPLAVHVSSATHTGLANNLEELLDALNQVSFHIKGSRDGLGSWEWICESADWSVGPSSGLDDFDLVTAPYGAIVTATVPRSPIPASGIF